MRAAIALLALTLSATSQEDPCAPPIDLPAPTPAPEAAAAGDDAPGLVPLRVSPLGEVSLADESLAAFGLFGVELRVEQGRRTANDAPATDLVPTLLVVDGEAAGVRAVRYLDSGRRIPEIVSTLGLADGADLEITLTNAELVEVRASHRSGFSRQTWELVPDAIAWRVVRADEELGEAARFDLITGDGVLDPADVTAWTVTVGDEPSDASLVALAIEEDVDAAGAPRATLWRRPDAHTPTLLAASHIGTIVPKVTLEVAGPKRELTDVVVAAMRVELDRHGRPYEVVTLVAASATWTSENTGVATLGG